MNLRRALRRTAKVGLALLVVLLVTVAIGGFVATRFPSTPAFRDETGAVLPDSVAAFERVELGGLRQTVLMRGKRVSNPVLLYLHGGPGSSELALVRHFNAALEDHFIVVLWEQRGAGKSYSPFIDPSSMTIDQFVSDAEELARWLGRRFGKDRIYLVGHSWGSLVGLRLAHQHPELFQAYVGIGQAVSFQEGERLSLRWTMEQAQAAQNLEAIAELRSLVDYPNGDGGGLGAVFTERKWLRRGRPWSGSSSPPTCQTSRSPRSSTG
jgi:pimeloyl-ACP methyl ester carboxylesterase